MSRAKRGFLTSAALGVCLAVADPGAVAAQPASAAAQQETAPAGRAQAREEIDAMAVTALERLLSTVPEAEALYDDAQGYAVFRATKAGLIVTGAGGTGVVVDRHTGERTYMHMGSGGIGVGAGAQTYRLAILFETREALNRFIGRGWDASTTAQAAAGKDGVSATSSFVDGVAFYQLTDRGLMAQADLSGTHFWVSERLNDSSTNSSEGS